MNLSKEQVTEIANTIDVDYASLMAFISVESGGLGFSKDTKMIIIQLNLLGLKGVRRSEKMMIKSPGLL